MSAGQTQRLLLLIVLAACQLATLARAQDNQLKTDFDLTFMLPTKHSAPQLANGREFSGEPPTLRLEKSLLPRGGNNNIGIYADKELEVGPQSANIEGENIYGLYSPKGLPRGLALEYRVLQQRNDDSTGTGTQQNSTGLSVNGYIDTPQHGLLSVNANLVTSESAWLGSTTSSNASRHQTWRIDQRGFALNNNWRGDHSAGFTYTPMSSLARGASRVSLTSHALQGLTGEWTNGTNLTFNAAAGRQGFFTGRDSQGFVVQSGNLQSLGGQLKLSGSKISDVTAHSAIAVQALQASDGSTINFSGSETQIPRERLSLWSSYVWQGAAPWGSGLNPGDSAAISQRLGGLRVQAHVIQNENAKGTSLEAIWRTNKLQHTTSLFHYEPGLRWGITSLANDIRGVSWRADFSARAWSTGGGVEFTNRISDPNLQNNFANGFIRYRLDSRNSTAANWAIRTGQSPGHSNQFTWDRLSDWGQSQWRVDTFKTELLRTQRLGLDQRWPASTTSSLTTGVALSQTNQAGLGSNAIEWGILGTTNWSRARLDMNIRSVQTLQGDTSGASTNAGVDISWPLAPNWSLVGQFNLNKGKNATPLVLTSASSQPSILNTTTYQGQTFIIALRYQDHAGSASAPLGGALGTAFGSIEGVVFLDEDRNGQRGSSEIGAEGVTLLLDRRFQTRTDSQGRFRFASVAIGEHSIELIPDNVPLPWYSPHAGIKTLRVDVRSTTKLDYALQRDR